MAFRINSASRSRGRFGAMQSRLQYTINSLNVQSENLAAADSRIRDVDIAYETVQLTRNSIMQQVAVAMLAQANAQPQLVLQLLG